VILTWRKIYIQKKVVGAKLSWKQNSQIYLRRDENREQGMHPGSCKSKHCTYPSI